VTSAAMIRMNTGMRISCGMKRAQAATAPPDSAITSTVASDRLTPLTRLVLTASSGHRPRIWTMLVFCFQMPLLAMVRNSSRLIIGDLAYFDA
jgi:hypothetical protein